MDSGVPGVERETHRRIASKSWLEREVERKNRKNNRNQLGSAYFFKQVDGSIDFSLLKSEWSAKPLRHTTSDPLSYLVLLIYMINQSALFGIFMLSSASYMVRVL